MKQQVKQVVSEGVAEAGSVAVLTCLHAASYHMAFR